MRLRCWNKSRRRQANPKQTPKKPLKNPKNKMQRDSFIFYRSFYEAMQEIGETECGKLLKIVCRYALDGEQPNGDTDPMLKALFLLLKPQIDKNNARYENGCKGGEYGTKGGRPKNPKQTPSKPQANPKQTPNDNDNDNDNDNVNDLSTTTTRAHTHTHEGEGSEFASTEKFYIELKTELLGDTNTAAQMQMHYGKTRGEMLRYLDAFHRNQQIEGNSHSNRSDYRKHFNSWMQIQVREGQQPELAAKQTYKSETEKILHNADTFTADTAGSNDFE